MEKVSFISKLFGFNTKRTSPVKSPEPEYSGPLTFFGTPENQYISGQNEARAAVANAFSQMLAYNEQRKLAINDKAMMCRSDYQAKWQLPMLLYIELNDMVIMFEDYYKIFDYLGLSKLLSSNKFSSAPKFAPKAQGVYGDVDIHFDEQITFDRYVRIIGPAGTIFFSFRGEVFARFKCGEFYILVVRGSRHILIAPQKASIHYEEIDSCQPFMDPNWRLKRYGFQYRSNDKKYKMQILFSESGEYKVIFIDENAKIEVRYNSTDFSREEFCNLVKNERKEWRKKFSQIEEVGISYYDSESLYDVFYVSIKNIHERYYGSNGYRPYQTTDVRVKLPDNLLSC